MHKIEEHGTGIVFGPLWSRRLGWSLGVNHLPRKLCTYSCIYCQIGTTRRRVTGRRPTAAAIDVRRAVAERVERCRQLGKPVDYVTFVPTGEPTLDSNLGDEIRAVKEFGLKVAVLTNGSLLTRTDVRTDLMPADVVSVKVDALRPRIWRRINRPAEGLELAAIRDAIVQFSDRYEGRLLTETMIVRGVNDEEAPVHRLAHFLAKLDPHRAYLTSPTRVPATDIEAADERKMARLFSIVASHVRSAGLLIAGYPLMLTDVEDPGRDLVSAVTVHPMCEESVDEYLEAAGRDWSLVEELIESGALRTRRYGSKIHIVRGPGAATAVANRLERSRTRRGGSR